jgi:hypothetical protein
VEGQGLLIPARDHDGLARRVLPEDAAPVRGHASVLSILLAACARAPAEPSPPSPGGTTVFSREAFAPPPADAGAGESAKLGDTPSPLAKLGDTPTPPGDAPPPAPSVPRAPDPAALDELIAAAAKPREKGADRTALIGTDTGLRGDGGAVESAPVADTSRGARVQLGKVTVDPGMSSPSIERAARAQLYWPLVQRCRDLEGAILPPEVVHLTFHLDRDGYVVPSTILVVPREARFAEAARCMARELGMATFRAPAAARGMMQTVSMDVPSVD